MDSLGTCGSGTAVQRTGAQREAISQELNRRRKVRLSRAALADENRHRRKLDGHVSQALKVLNADLMNHSSISSTPFERVSSNSS